MKQRRKIKNYLLRFLDQLPFDLLGRFMRFRFRIKSPSGKRKKIIFKVAETADELNQALKLLQSTYVKSGLTSDVDSKMRILKYNLLPTTTVFIAKYKGKVIGTVSHVLDSEFGLPLDNFIDISTLRKTGKRKCEISGLAVKRKWRSQRKGVFFPMIFAALKHSFEVSGIDEYYMITNYSGNLFYKHLLFTEQLECDNKNYSGANNAEAYAQRIDIDKVLVEIREKYKSKNLFRNMYMLWVVFPWRKNCQFRNLATPLAVSPALEKEQLVFVKENIKQFSSVLTDKESAHLNNMYHLNTCDSQIQKRKSLKLSERKTNRYLVNFNVHFIEGDHLLKVKVHDISISGFTILVDSNNQIPQRLVGRFTIDGYSDLLVKGKLIWKTENKAAFQISLIDFQRWNCILKDIENQYSAQDTFVA
jgi:hypothetical protein